MAPFTTQTLIKKNMLTVGGTHTHSNIVLQISFNNKLTFFSSINQHRNKKFNVCV